MMESAYARTIVEHLRTAVICLDDGNRVVHLNPAAELLFGLSVRQMRGEHLATILPYNSAFCAQLGNIKVQDRVCVEHSLHLRCPRQGEMIVECAITPLRLDDMRLLLEFIKVAKPIGQLTFTGYIYEKWQLLYHIRMGLAMISRREAAGLFGLFLVQVLYQDAFL